MKRTNRDERLKGQKHAVLSIEGALSTRIFLFNGRHEKQRSHNSDGSRQKGRRFEMLRLHQVVAGAPLPTTGRGTFQSQPSRVPKTKLNPSVSQK